MLCVCVLLFVGIANAAVAQDASPADESAQTEPASEVVVSPQAADRQIADRLESILRASGWFEAPTVSVREGIAFLDGTTQTDDRKTWAGSLARKTQDVVAVVNRIEVEPTISWDWTPALRELRNLANQFQHMVPLLLIGGVILFASWYLARGVGVLARRFFADRIQSPLLGDLVSRAVAIPFFLIGVYLVLQVAGLTRLALTVLGGTGVLGIVLGFAFRDIAENFLASLLLSMRNPFQAGDLIEVSGMRGTVRNLNTRSTILLTSDGNHVRIPNAMVFKSIITNFSSNSGRRGEFSVGIGYDDSVATAQQIILEAITAHEAVLAEPPPMVLVGELAASTVTLRIYFWYDGKKYKDIKVSSALMRRVKHALIAGGISMPDEAREVIFPQGLPLFKANEPTSKITKKSSPGHSAKPTRKDQDAVTVGEANLSNDDEHMLRNDVLDDGSEAEENLLEQVKTEGFPEGNR